MKALYEIAEVEIVKFAIEDIITTSSVEGGDDSGNTGNQGGSGGPNEGEPGSGFPGVEW